MRNPITTLCYIRRDNAYLMLHRIKKENDVNKDKWIGIGGHLEDGESPEECLLREIKEETGLTVASYDFRGLVTFVTTEGLTEYMCLYTACVNEPVELKECDEGNLEWVDKAKFLSMNLWEGDYIFLALLDTKNTFFSLKLVYDKDTLIEAVLDGTPILDIKEEIQKSKSILLGEV